MKYDICILVLEQFITGLISATKVLGHPQSSVSDNIAEARDAINLLKLEQNKINAQNS